MRQFLSAFSLPVFLVTLMVAVVMCLTAPANAQEVPQTAHKYRNDLTRIAQSVWGLDAPVPVFAAQVQQESGWNPKAVSRVGAVGMTQFMPTTATWWCALNKIDAADCQPRNPIWAMRALAGYDLWLYQRVYGQTEYDRLWAALRAYNGGLGHWQKEAALKRPALNHEAIDAACGLSSRARVHCAENLGYPDRILNKYQSHYAYWGRTVSEK